MKLSTLYWYVPCRCYSPYTLHFRCICHTLRLLLWYWGTTIWWHSAYKRHIINTLVLERQTSTNIEIYTAVVCCSENRAIKISIKYLQNTWYFFKNINKMLSDLCTPVVHSKTLKNKPNNFAVEKMAVSHRYSAIYLSSPFIWSHDVTCFQWNITITSFFILRTCNKTWRCVIQNKARCLKLSLLVILNFTLKGVIFGLYILLVKKKSDTSKRLSYPWPLSIVLFYVCKVYSQNL